GEFASAALRRRIDPGEVEAEATAQMRKLQSAGITLSHFDTHKHAHMFPALLRPLLRAARACGVRAVRNPFAPVRPLAFAHLLRRPRLWKRYSQVLGLRRLLDGFRRAVQEHEMFTTDGTFGIVTTGALDLRLFEAIAGCIPEGTWEFVCHPGYNDAELSGIRTRLRKSRVQELQVLTSPEARAVLERHGVELISFRDL
ncbi:MAG TPA: ChbG/HpnK family deacetylase, partial [Terriglobales bacterium]|nr:ChbG/HpnK family deacetylase [Terriglobales bacterium]